MQGRLKKHGFAFFVSLALVGAGLLAGSAATPQPVPDYALQAEEIYRLEIGAASFVVFYLAVMAIALALDGRGFAEFGTKGLKAEQVVASGRQQEALASQLRAIRRTEERLQELHVQVESLQRKSASRNSTRR